jgi:hypothetical protein
MLSSQKLQWASGQQGGVPGDGGAVVTEAAAQPAVHASTVRLPNEIPAPAAAAVKLEQRGLKQTWVPTVQAQRWRRQQQQQPSMVRHAVAGTQQHQKFELVIRTGW